MNVIFTILSLILNYLSLKLVIAVYRGFFIKYFFFVFFVTLIFLYGLVISYSVTSSLLRLRIAGLAP